MWDLGTLQKLNDEKHCDWLAKRIIAVLLEGQIPVGDKVRADVDKFVRTLPAHEDFPSIY